MMINQKKSNIHFAFFGTSHIARYVLEELADAGYLPSRIVTSPDRTQGRGLILTASSVSEWADLHGIPTDKPEKLTLEWIKHFAKSSWDVCIVADYGLILPKRLLTVPAKGFLNMHPSLLPKLRGPSPIRSAILNDERDTGVSIMLLDSKMDHGPIIAQEHVPVPEWPPRAQVLEEFLAQAGGRLLAHTLPNWVKGTVLVHEQEHEHATFSKLFTKSDAYINLSEDPYQVLLKVRAFETWPGAYTFFERNGKSIRVLIIDAHIGQGGNLALDRVKPEGKNEMDYTAFASSGAVPASITHRE